MVKVFRTLVENQPRHYALYQPNDEIKSFLIVRFPQAHDQHWQIEQYHRGRQNKCASIEHFQVRQPTAIRNHLFAAICGYVQLQTTSRLPMRIRNCYRLQRELFNEVIAAFIKALAPNLGHLNLHFQPPVNASPMVSKWRSVYGPEMPDVVHLFERRPMILLDLLVLVMEFEKGRCVTINSVPLFVIRWTYKVYGVVGFSTTSTPLTILKLWRFEPVARPRASIAKVGRPALDSMKGRVFLTMGAIAGDIIRSVYEHNLDQDPSDFSSPARFIPVPA